MQDGRHSHVSMLVAMGCDVMEVAQRIGHSDASVTLKIYAHLFAKRSVPPLGTRFAEFRRQEVKGLSLALLPDRKLPDQTGTHTEVAGEKREKVTGEGLNRIAQLSKRNCYRNSIRSVKVTLKVTLAHDRLILEGSEHSWTGPNWRPQSLRP